MNQWLIPFITKLKLFEESASVAATEANGHLGKSGIGCDVPIALDRLCSVARHDKLVRVVDQVVISCHLQHLAAVPGDVFIVEAKRQRQF
jgi:hypothetical protein